MGCAIRGMLIASTVLAAAALAAENVSAARAEELRLGAAGPFTGPEASFGEQMASGAELAVADINARGGILGRRVTLELGDDQCDPRQAVSVANDLAGREVAAVVGHFCSSSSIPAAAVYHESGIPMVTPASTNPALTDEAAAKGWQEIFRVCGRDDAQGSVSGRYLAAHYRKVAIVHDRSAFGTGVAEETRKAMNAAGLKEVLVESINQGERDFSAVVSKLKDAGVEAVYYGGYQTEAGLLIRQSRDQGLAAVFVASDGILADDFWAIAGTAAEGTLMTHPPDPRSSAAGKAVVEALKARGESPDGFALYSYAAFQVLAQAAEAAGSAEPEAIVAALRSGRTFDTVIGPIRFDAKGDVVDPSYVMYAWRGGTYAELN